MSLSLPPPPPHWEELLHGSWYRLRSPRVIRSHHLYGLRPLERAPDFGRVVDAPSPLGSRRIGSSRKLALLPNFLSLDVQLSSTPSLNLTVARPSAQAGYGPCLIAAIGRFPLQIVWSRRLGKRELHPDSEPLVTPLVHYPRFCATPALSVARPQPKSNTRPSQALLGPGSSTTGPQAQALLSSSSWTSKILKLMPNLRPR